MLTEKEVDHIVIEATDHVGGRVVSMEFEGKIVNKGASFIHNATKGNPIADFVKKYNRFPTVNGTANYDTIFYEGYKTGAIPL